MADELGTVDLILREVGQAVAPLSEAATRDPVPSGLTSLLIDSGVDVTALGVTPGELSTICQDLGPVLTSIQHLVSSPDLVTAEQLGGQLQSLIVELRKLDKTQPPADLGAVSERLVAHLLTEHLRAHHRGLYAFLRLAGLMVEPHSGTTGPAPRLDPGRFGLLLSDPNKLLAQAYGWGSEAVDFALLLDHLQQLMIVLGFPAIPHQPDSDVINSLAVDPLTLPSPALRVAIANVTSGGVFAEVGIEVLPRHAGGAADSVAIVPYGAGSVSEKFTLADPWNLNVDAEGDADVPYGVVIAPGKVSFSAVDGTARLLQLKVRIAIERGQPTGVSRTILGSPSGSRLDVGTLSLALQASVNPSDVGLELAGTDWRIVAKADPDDGFLNTLLPKDGIQIPFALGVGWSHSKGIYLVGSAGLRVDLEIAKDLGPVHIGTITVVAVAGTSTSDPSTEPLRVSAALTGGLAFGPFLATIKEIGVYAELRPRDPHANAGVGQIAAGFKPPVGAGLAIRSPAASGGGFLLFDPDAGQYAGVFELTIVGTVSVKAIAIITTKMPDGSPGFALLILITAEGFTPIQLGLGFSLTGIGGLLALNHTVDADAVRGGLRSGVLDSVLFVKDPVKNAPRVISTLNHVFPLAADRLLIGPLAEISWGTPPLVKIRLALLLEVPQPIRVILLAALSMMLPTPQDAVVEIHIDSIGVLDFGRRELALDASLHDSRILQFTLTGDMALRLNWGDEPTFVMSIGGFHPKFTPPKGLRPLNRLALTLSSGDNPRVRFEAYLALTSNTIQMGARVDVHAEEGPFALDGGGSFDALIQWSPFSLDVSFAAWAKITSGGSTLLAASVALEVTGPRPWHLTGQASVQVLAFTATVGVDFTVGTAPSTPEVTETVDVGAEIWAQLSDPACWAATLPPTATPGVTMAGLPVASGTAPLVAHPLATVSVREQIAPLGTSIERVGGRLPVGGTRSYTASVSAPAGVVGGTVTELFAPGQYANLPDDARLAGPSFAPMTGGVSLTPQTAAAAGPQLSCDLAVQTLDVTSLDAPATPGAWVAAEAGTARGPVPAPTPAMGQVTT